MFLNRNEHHNMPATINVLTVAGTLHWPLRLTPLTEAIILCCPLRLIIYHSGRSCGQK